MDNSPGTVVEMERNQVDDNKDQTCSTGLHFCGLSYLDHFGGSDSRVVIVKIDPADVVSIPSDYNGAKGRACRYEVIGEMGVKAEDAFTAPVQSNAHGTATVRAPAPEPKVNHGPFSKGYTDGYTGQRYNPGDFRSLKEQKAYEDGFDAGRDDSDMGDPERYRYEPKPVVVGGQWPFPTHGGDGI
jgi:hypothetical protein